MRLFAIDDIHGCGTALNVMLAAINLQADDKVITLGDYINKDPETRGVFELRRRLSSKGILVPLLGHHELKMMAAQGLNRPRLENSGLIDQNTLNSYSSGEGPAHLDNIPEQHWRLVDPGRDFQS